MIQNRLIRPQVTCRKIRGKFIAFADFGFGMGGESAENIGPERESSHRS
jgi:hypothetical protein